MRDVPVICQPIPLYILFPKIGVPHSTVCTAFTLRILQDNCSPGSMYRVILYEHTSNKLPRGEFTGVTFFLI